MKISVITPNFNGAKFLEATILSVLENAKAAGLMHDRAAGATSAGLAEQRAWSKIHDAEESSNASCRSSNPTT